MRARAPALVCRMLPTEPLTSADLDRLGQASFDHEQPDALAAEIVTAVEQGRIADQADTGYALLLAAEITERAADATTDTSRTAAAVGAALGLSERAITAYHLHTDPDYGYPRAFRAGLLFRAGREDDAMAELTALRPLLCEDDDAVCYISDVLQQHGRTALAEQWLSTALTTALRRRHTLATPHARTDPAYEQAATVAFTLAQQRYRLRRELDLAHDDHDELAERLATALLEELHPDPHTHDHPPIAVLFWPQEQFNNLLERWPRLTQEYGHNWDEHRTHVQRRMTMYSESGRTHLATLAGNTDELATYASRTNTDPTHPNTRERYAQHLVKHPRETPWPPHRNQPCWCGSSTKYKKCCLPRTRTS